MSSDAITHPLLAEALSRGQTTLDESMSKQLLAEFGLPQVAEAVVDRAEEAGAAAEKIGFPVVLKALGASLLHKSDRGLVRAGLRSVQEVEGAAAQMVDSTGADLEGFLVQPQVTGRREFLLGAKRDPLFGPVVVLGVGGVLAEAFADVAVRVAPVTGREVADMLAELRATALFGPFRGEEAVDVESLAAALSGLGRLLLEQPLVKEVDVNPLMAGPDGTLTAVDALVVLEPSAPAEPELEDKVLDLERVFAPESVALVGASAHFGKWGYTLPTNLLAGGYEGRVELVNPGSEQMFGQAVRTGIGKLDEPVDLAVLTIPAAGVLGALDELAQRGVRAVVVVSSGFSESGPEGASQEAELVQRARQHGLTVIGPNTMGVCNPHARFFCTGAHVRPRAGGTALLSQSGNMGVQLLSFAESQGLGIRAFCGTGNEALVGVEDLLEYFGRDPVTRVVVLYVESVRRGRRFLRVATEVGRSKPVVLLKGGRTAAGQKAASTHTGAMASDQEVFSAACRQAGVVEVDQPLELVDASAAFSSLPLPRGNRVAIMTWGGGWGVVTADLCAEQGLRVPDLTPQLVASLDRWLPPYWSRENPVDLVGEVDTELPTRVLEELMRWEGADAVISLGMMGRSRYVDSTADSAGAVDTEMSPEFLARLRSDARAFEAQHVETVVNLTARYSKPVIGVSLVPDSEGRTVYGEVGGHRALFFSSPERAVKVLARMWEYARFLGAGTKS